MDYTTKNKALIVSLLNQHKDEHLTIDQISELLKKEGCVVPTASIYRIINKLLRKRKIRKFLVEDKSACFQIIGEEDHNHFHLLCSNCGKLIHLECDEVDEIINHIGKEHGFTIDVSKINLYGLCSECRRKNDK